jgi:hypothetical protein
MRFSLVIIFETQMSANALIDKCVAVKICPAKSRVFGKFPFIKRKSREVPKTRRSCPLRRSFKMLDFADRDLSARALGRPDNDDINKAIR